MECGRGLMSARGSFELERSNLLLHVVNSDEKRLKAVSEEVPLVGMLERKIKNK